jgi:hypothetical protein
MTSYGTGMQDTDTLDRVADDVGLESATNNLDLGKLRHEQVSSG